MREPRSKPAICKDLATMPSSLDTLAEGCFIAGCALNVSAVYIRIRGEGY